MFGVTIAAQKGMKTSYNGRRNALAHGLGAAYRPPLAFAHGDWTLVAALPALADGYDVRVYECRMPAVFYRVEALPTPNSSGEPRPGFAFETGTVDGGLVTGLAKAIAGGMIGPAAAALK